MFRRLDLTGARIVLTGASSGIGWALAEELAKHRARLVLAARSRPRLEELAAQLRPRSVDVQVAPTDVAVPEQRRQLVATAVAAFGGIDILINNAGVGASGYFADATEACLRRIFEVNFFGATELTRLALPYLGHGANPMIVNVSSVIGRRAVPGYNEYCASKFALCGWSEALRAELSRRGIHVLLVCPGLIATPFRDNLVEDQLRSQVHGARGMDPARCARIMVRAMQRRRREVVITFGGKFLLWLNRWLPGLTDSLLTKYAPQAGPGGTA